MGHQLSETAAAAVDRYCHRSESLLRIAAAENKGVDSWVGYARRGEGKTEPSHPNREELPFLETWEFWFSHLKQVAEIKATPCQKPLLSKYVLPYFR